MTIPPPAAPLTLGRLARSGFEEVAIFSLRRAWRNAERQRKGGSAAPNLRFFSAIRTLSGTPSFRRFLEAMQEEGAAWAQGTHFWDPAAPWNGSGKECRGMTVLDRLEDIGTNSKSPLWTLG
jgi:hypothetical protein